MPEFSYNTFKAWADNTAIDGADTDALLRQAIDCGDIVVVEIGADPFNGGKPATRYVGLETRIETLFIEAANVRREEWLKAEAERKELERECKRQEREARERAQRELEERLERERQERIARDKLAQANARKRMKDYLTSLAVSQIRDSRGSEAAKRIATMPFKECEEGGSGSVMVSLVSYDVRFIEQVAGEVETFEITEANSFEIVDAAIESGLIVYSRDFAGTGRDG